MIGSVVTALSAAILTGCWVIVYTLASPRICLSVLIRGRLRQWFIHIHDHRLDTTCLFVLKEEQVGRAPIKPHFLLPQSQTSEVLTHWWRLCSRNMVSFSHDTFGLKHVQPSIRFVKAWIKVQGKGLETCYCIVQIRATFSWKCDNECY